MKKSLLALAILATLGISTSANAGSSNGYNSADCDPCYWDDPRKGDHIGIGWFATDKLGKYFASETAVDFRYNHPALTMIGFWGTQIAAYSVAPALPVVTYALESGWMSPPVKVSKEEAYLFTVADNDGSNQQALRAVAVTIKNYQDSCRDSGGTPSQIAPATTQDKWIDEFYKTESASKDFRDKNNQQSGGVTGFVNANNNPYLSYSITSVRLDKSGYPIKAGERKALGRKSYQFSGQYLTDVAQTDMSPSNKLMAQTRCIKEVKAGARSAYFSNPFIAWIEAGAETEVVNGQQVPRVMYQEITNAGSLVREKRNYSQRDLDFIQTGEMKSAGLMQ